MILASHTAQCGLRAGKPIRQHVATQSGLQNGAARSHSTRSVPAACSHMTQRGVPEADTPYPQRAALLAAAVVAVAMSAAPLDAQAAGGRSPPIQGEEATRCTVEALDNFAGAPPRMLVRKGASAPCGRAACLSAERWPCRLHR